MQSFTRTCAKLAHWLNTRRTFFVFCLSFLALTFYIFPAQAEFTLTDPVTKLVLESTIGVLAWIVNIIAWAVGQLIVAVLGMLIIPILGYNNFGNSAIIDIGWPLVRDVVNMFVIVVLLVIAVKTILNSSSANWEQQLPRMFIAVILVNFSRTITLLMVDAGQVVMFTFVNALRDIAAGNFITMFQMNSLLSMGEQKGGSGVELFGFLGTAYASLVLLMIVLAVLVILAIVFVYRIVIIWILVILSPAAFFLMGVKDIFSQAGGAYSQWWSKLIGAVTLGPILTFFLWLGLAAATGGSYASTEGFTTDASDDSAGNLYAEIFHVDELLSMFVGILLIMVGFQAASSAAGSLGGFAATLVSEQRGMSIAKNAVALPASLGYKGLRAGARQFERRTGLGAKVGERLTEAGAGLAKTPGLGFVGRGVMSAGGALGGYAEASVKQARANAKEDVSKMTTARKNAELLSMSVDEKGNFKAPASSKAMGHQEALMVELVTNKQARKNLKTQLEDKAKEQMTSIDQNKNLSQPEKDKRKEAIQASSKKEYESAISRSIQYVEKNKVNLLDESQKKSFFGAKAGNMRHMLNKYRDGEGNVTEANKAKALIDVNEMISDDDFGMSMLSEDDMKDETVLEALKQKTVRMRIDEQGHEVQVKMIEDVESGKGVADDVKNAAQGKGATFDKSNSAEIGQAVKHDNLVVRSLKVEELTTDGSSNVTSIETGAGTRLETVAKGFAMSKSDISDVSAVLRPLVEAEIARLNNPTITKDPEMRKVYEKAQFSADNNIARAANNFVGSIPGSAVTADRKKMIQEIVVEQPTQLYKLEAHIDDAIANPTFKDAQDVLQVVAREASTKVADDMQKKLTKAINDPSGGDMKKRIKDSAATAFKAVKAEYEKAIAVATAAGSRTPASDIDVDLRNKYRKWSNFNRVASNS